MADLKAETFWMGRSLPAMEIERVMAVAEDFPPAVAAQAGPGPDARVRAGDAVF